MIRNPWQAIAAISLVLGLGLGAAAADMCFNSGGPSSPRRSSACRGQAAAWEVWGEQQNTATLMNGVACTRSDGTALRVQTSVSQIGSSRHRVRPLRSRAAGDDGHRPRHERRVRHRHSASRRRLRRRSRSAHRPRSTSSSHASSERDGGEAAVPPRTLGRYGRAAASEDARGAHAPVSARSIFSVRCDAIAPTMVSTTRCSPIGNMLGGRCLHFGAVSTTMVRHSSDLLSAKCGSADG